MMYSPIVLLGLAAFAAAAPVANEQSANVSIASVQVKGASTTYLSNFDNLSPGLVENSISTQDVGPYNGLFWHKFKVAKAGINGKVTLGVEPRTSPNEAYFAGKESLITSVFKGTVVSTFDLRSFYFGCQILPVTALASLPTSCKVTVTGYKGKKLVATEVFSYKPTTLALKAPMIQAKLSSKFKGLNVALFSTEYSGLHVIGATLLDNVAYTTYNK